MAGFGRKNAQIRKSQVRFTFAEKKVCHITCEHVFQLA